MHLHCFQVAILFGTQTKLLRVVMQQYIVDIDKLGAFDLVSLFKRLSVKLCAFLCGKPLWFCSGKLYLFIYFIYTIFQEVDIFCSKASLPYGHLNR